MTMVEQPKQQQQQQSYFEAKAEKQALAKGNKTAVSMACNWVVDNQIKWSAALLAIIHGHNQLVAGGNSAFVSLQHKIPGDPQGRYYRGYLDIYYVLHYVLVFTLVRATIMQHVLMPFIHWYGVRSTRKITRFAEQGWLTIFYIVSNSAGLYVMSKSPHWMNTRNYWADYPEGHRQMTYLMKSYYLVQMGFWFQQIFVLLIEEKRKDFFAMCTHHIVTCTLLGMSLYMNFTRVGNAILCCMDMADIFLSGTKCLRYMGYEKPAEASFVFFLFSWIYTRHYLFIKIIMSIKFESKTVLGGDRWDPANGSYYTRPVIACFTILLGILQLLLLYWLMLMFRIVYRIVVLRNLDDSRSDSEGEGADGDAKQKEE
ncbi:Sphingosine N-acyltransferase lag1 [Coemansia sp. IMI 203386]|nr:Sphingosine N-acyltransferase lag1 [Coemansia sp. IMI 203386]